MAYDSVVISKTGGLVVVYRLWIKKRLEGTSKRWIRVTEIMLSNRFRAGCRGRCFKLGVRLSCGALGYKETSDLGVELKGGHVGSGDN